MKKTPVFLIVLLSLLLNTAKAQSPDTSTTEKLLSYALQNLDKSQVSTGFLQELSMPVKDLGTYNGILTDSNKMDITLWRLIYFEMQKSYCGTGSNPLPLITNVNTKIKSFVSAVAPVPVPLLIGNYNSIKSYAFTNNLLSYNSTTNQFADVSSRTENPYQVNNLFAAAPQNKYSATGTSSFLFSDSIIWNNSGKTISQIQVDFDNTLGFKTITRGTPITVSYADTGVKRWTIRVTFTDNSTLQCYSDYHVFVASTANTASRFHNSWDDHWNITGSNHSGADVYIAYSTATATGTLRKPLIIVQGFDEATYFINSGVALPGFSTPYDYDALIRDLDDPNFRDPVTSYDFNNALDQAGYDVVLVVFKYGSDDIVRNARAVQQVIEAVNTAKVTTTKNVIVGLSMGGLVARYALASMTKNSIDPDTRILASFDSPHQGANVPLGLQYLLQMTGQMTIYNTNIRDIFPQYDAVMGLLNEPASQQMLIYRSTGMNTYATNTFLNGDYRNMVTFSPTGVQPAYKFLAISNGSECGHPLYQPYQNLISADAVAALSLVFASYKFVSTVRAYALPATGQTSEIAKLYVKSQFRIFGINISKQVFDASASAPGTHLPIDGAPGGTSPESFKFSGYAFVGDIAGVVFNVNLDFCFVPIASSLDVTPFNNGALATNYVEGVNSVYRSAANNFIANATVNSLSNIPHTTLSARAALWLYDEIETVSNTVNCSAECVPVYAIAGDDAICTTSVYTIPSLQPGMSVSWSLSSTRPVTSSVSGNTLPSLLLQRSPAPALLLLSQKQCRLGLLLQ
jgi:hypothetical protein